MSTEDSMQHKIQPEQLPPLDETAEVPMQHRDDVNTPGYLQDKFDAPSAVVPPEHRDDRHQGSSRGIKIGAGIAGLALLGGAFVGAKAFGGSSDSEAPHRETPTSAPASPTPTAEAPAPKTLADYLVTVANNPSVESAAQSLVDLENAYANSPSYDPLIMQAMFGNDAEANEHTPILTGQLEGVRQSVQDMMKTLKEGNNKTGTYTARFLPETADSVYHAKPGVNYDVKGTIYYETNFDEPPYNNQNFDYEQTYTITVAYDKAGNWHIANQVPTSDRTPTTE